METEEGQDGKSGSCTVARSLCNSGGRDGLFTSRRWIHLGYNNMAIMIDRRRLASKWLQVQ